ncbi:hypothetical protein EQ836_25350 [Ectopseudomonas mendocina]|uniref:Transposase n=1 Tax=Ectopseudomonas mendocina TaxID=300 RepID=A0ABD7RNZ2_ECTME|nr:hypothetical protein [Pseudomonas mendocina]TRO07546.1 hypothetical protein EQ829_25340 [Pseudomonas mendocina]TRO10695.1 hypothetical protein EQ836_25350 [Pseudomonas mendocina]
MKHVEISKSRQRQLAVAFRAGRTAATQHVGELLVSIQVCNPYSERGCMPESMASVRCAQWHAFNAGVERQMGKISNASTALRNARFFMRSAAAIGCA